MVKGYIENSRLSSFPLWEKISSIRTPIDFELEITARCNNNCRHCYINIPSQDDRVKNRELSINELESIVDQAIELGSLWCLVSGGEPLLRDDFEDIYLMLKRKGLLVSIFSNACLLRERHIALFKRYPPRDIEVTVYGITKDTYEKVTRKAGSYHAFRRGLDLLISNNIRVRLKAMAMRTNLHELKKIAQFCQKHTMDYFRFDPLLHLRYDRDQKRNQEIIAERLSADEILQIEKNDPQRIESLRDSCDHYIFEGRPQRNCNHLITCGAGNRSFTVSPEGLFRLCSSLWHPDCLFDLKHGTLKDAWQNFVPQIRSISSARKSFLEKCHSCSIINLCLWCPANAYLENGCLDEWVPYFCDVAKNRAENLRETKNGKSFP